MAHAVLCSVRAGTFIRNWLNSLPQPLYERARVQVLPGHARLHLWRPVPVSARGWACHHRPAGSCLDDRRNSLLFLFAKKIGFQFHPVDPSICDLFDNHLVVAVLKFILFIAAINWQRGSSTTSTTTGVCRIIRRRQARAIPAQQVRCPVVVHQRRTHIGCTHRSPCILGSSLHHTPTITSSLSHYSSTRPTQSLHQ